MNSDVLLNIPGQKQDSGRLFKLDLSLYLSHAECSTCTPKQIWSLHIRRQ